MLRTNPTQRLNILLGTILALSASIFGQLSTADQRTPSAVGPLEATIDHFDLDDAILRDGVSQLTSKDVKNLHLGFEEIIRERIQDDPGIGGPRVAVHVKQKTVREILDELCQQDLRYIWSEDGDTVNIYPRATIDDRSYLLNLFIQKIALTSIPDPDQALTPLSRMFPEQQVGYSAPGLGDNSYSAPWTAVFERLTVRQFVDRLAEHMGPQTSWVWQGGNGERMFTFVKGGFHTQ